MKTVWFFLFPLLFIAACTAVTPTPVPTAAPTNTPPPTVESIFADEPLPTPDNRPYELKAIPQDKLIGECPFKISPDLQGRGVTKLSNVQYIGCQSGELGLLEIGDRLYAAVSGLGPTAFSLTDVTDPISPQPIGVWIASRFNLTYDLKPFRQGNRHFLALAYDDVAPQCGIAIVEVTDVHSPKVIGRFHGGNVGAETPWCNVHTVEVDSDAQGNANYLLASDTDTKSVRVLDIRDLNQIRQVNTFHLHAHPHVNPNDRDNWLNFVHDTSISDKHVYVSNWHAGVVILDKAKLYAGLPQQGIIVQPNNNLAPAGFLAHYAAPSPDDNYLFLEDEVNVENGMRVFDIHDPTQPREVATIRLDDPLYTPHNFIVQDNLLYVGWYQDGLQVFRLDSRNPNDVKPEPVAQHPVRKTLSYSGPYGKFNGLWGVRVHSCNVQGKARTCVYAADIQGGLIIYVLDEGIAQ